MPRSLYSPSRPIRILRQKVRIVVSLYKLPCAKPKPGMKKITNVFDIEFQPFIDEINVKEGVIRECADAATMERVKSKNCSTYQFGS